MPITSMLQPSSPDSVVVAMPRISIDLSTISDSQSSKGLNTFRGVFIPTVQNIIGILIFVRLSWIVGVAGLRDTYGIILFSVLCSVLTSCSLSAIMTNGKVQAGGSQSVIRETLGPSLGTSISLLYFCSLVFAATLEILGAGELIFYNLNLELPSFLSIYGPQLISVSLLLLLTILCFIGINIVATIAPLILLVVLAAFGSIIYDLFLGTKEIPGLLGFNVSNISSIWSPNYSEKTSFFSLLALFFPLVAGMLAGSDKSDTLKNPSSSIPTGTLSAVAFTTFIYLLLVTFFGGSIDRDTLLDNRQLTSLFGPPYLVLVGSVMVSLGSALQALSGAPRLLAGLCADIPVNFLQKFTVEPNKEPRIGLLFTSFVVFMFIVFGRLDFVAPVVTLCYLLYCCSINLSTFVLYLSKLPSFRPSFRYCSAVAAFAGALICFVFMILVSPLAVVVVLIALLLLVQSLKSYALKDSWGDSGFHVLAVQSAHRTLLSMNQLSSGKHTSGASLCKNWRPHIVAVVEMSGSPTKKDTDESANLISYLSYISKGYGLTLVVGIVNGTLLDSGAIEGTHLKLLNKLSKYYGLETFCKTVVGKDYNETIDCVLQATGLGPLKPNTILLSFNQLSPNELVPRLRTAQSCNFATLLLKGPPNVLGELGVTRYTLGSDIVLFWIIFDSALLLLLSHLLTKHSYWKGSTVRLYCVATQYDDSLKMKRDVERLVAGLRIKAVVRVLEFFEPSNPYLYDRTVRIKKRNDLFEELDVEESLRIEKVISECRREDGEVSSSQVPISVDLKLSTAVALNELIRRYSRADDLVMCNLPPVPSEGNLAEDYENFVFKLAEGVPQILFVKGSGTEVLVESL
ncbi:hypothetical protein RCL1_005018 [Eukaryota sp. TZLM3-RCL]